MIILFHTCEIKKTYMCVFYSYMEVKIMERYLSFIVKVADTLNLSKTDIEILATLHERRKLLVSEIAEHIKRSERHIRQRLHVLHEKRLLKREIEVLKNKRIAYRYSLRSTRNIIIEMRRGLLKKLDEIDKLTVE